jgi:hypothetical protein
MDDPDFNHEDATKTATFASIASGDRAARVHGLKALDALNEDDNMEAIAAHERAAARHSRLADETDGDESEAHDRVADLHRRAAQMHHQFLGATLNARGFLTLNSRQAIANAAADAAQDQEFDAAGGCSAALRRDTVQRRYQELKNRIQSGDVNNRQPLANVKLHQEFDYSAGHRARVRAAKERAAAEAYVNNAIQREWGEDAGTVDRGGFMGESQPRGAQVSVRTMDGALSPPATFAGGDTAWAAASRRNLIQGPFSGSLFGHSFDTSSTGMMQGDETDPNAGESGVEGASADGSMGELGDTYDLEDQYGAPMRHVTASPEGAGLDGFSAIAGVSLDAQEQADVDEYRAQRLGLHVGEGDEDELTAPGSMDEILTHNQADTLFDNPHLHR